MEILELNIKNFGKFENHRIALRPGVNIIYGGNEAGKSTIHSFLRAMLFGLNRGRGRAARTDEYQLRQPWETPGLFQGSMTISDQGEIYRIDRCFDRSTDPVRVYCESTHSQVKNPEEFLSSLLGGISESTFVNTLSVPQAQSETDETLAQELRRFMVNSEQSMDGRLDVSQALQILRRKKKDLEQRKKKEDAQTESEIEKQQYQAEQVRRELETLKRQLSLSEEGEETEYGNKKKRTVSSTQRWKIALELLLILAAAVTLAGAILLSEQTMKLFLGVFSGIFALMLFPVHFFMKDDQEEEQEQWDEGRDSGKNSYLQSRIAGLEEEYRKLQDKLEALYGSHVKPDGVDTEIAALSMAIDHICSVSSDIYARTGGTLNQRASEILSELTEGAYSRIRLDETGEVEICTDSRVLKLHQVSGGTMQQIYFVLRMAAGELLSENRMLPILLDETFAMYDDKRLEAALRWLRSSKRQVLLFTCQRRELEIMKKI